MYCVLISLIVAIVGFISSTEASAILYASGYTRDEGWINGTSKGMYTFHFDTIDGSITPYGVTDIGVNPTYIVGTTKNQVKQTLYVVHAVAESSDDLPGTKTGYISAITMGKNGQMTVLNRQETRGEQAVHLQLSPNEDFVTVANYVSSVSLLPILPDGSLATVSDYHAYTKGSLVKPDRQEASHVHSTTWVPNSNIMIAADLGADALLQYKLDAATQTLNNKTYLTVYSTPGAGPRHMSIHPSSKFVYVVNELTNKVAVYKLDQTTHTITGKLKCVQEISTIPSDFTNFTKAAAIKISEDGKFLYASNRGHDSIAVFQINKNTGRLTVVEITKTLGMVPWTFVLYKGFLIVGNQGSGDIKSFRIDTKTGKLTYTGSSVECSTVVALFMGEA